MHSCVNEIAAFFRENSHYVLSITTIILIFYFFWKARVAWLVWVVSLTILIFISGKTFQSEYATLLGGYLSALVIIGIYYLGIENERRNLLPLEAHTIQRLHYLHQNYLTFFAQALDEIRNTCEAKNKANANLPLHLFFKDFNDVLEYSSKDAISLLQDTRMFRSYKNFFKDLSAYIKASNKLFDLDLHEPDDNALTEEELMTVNDFYESDEFEEAEKVLKESIVAFENCFSKYFIPDDPAPWRK